MAVITKRVRLELDAYERLRLASLPGESFSAVVRRLCPSESPGPTGAELLEWFSADKQGASEEYLDSLEGALQHNPPADNPRH
jgi:predicted CopG family antitoxin